jgi:hypothetical protein
MGEAGKVVAVVDHPSESNGRVVAEFAQHGEQQAVVLEAVSAAPAHDDAIEQLLRIERQRVVQADTDAAERERSDVPSDDLCEELECRLARLQPEGTEMAVCEPCFAVPVTDTAVAAVGHAHSLHHRPCSDLCRVPVVDNRVTAKVSRSSVPGVSSVATSIDGAKGGVHG